MLTAIIHLSILIDAVVDILKNDLSLSRAPQKQSNHVLKKCSKVFSYPVSFQPNNESMIRKGLRVWPASFVLTVSDYYNDSEQVSLPLSLQCNIYPPKERSSIVGKNGTMKIEIWDFKGTYIHKNDINDTLGFCLESTYMWKNILMYC